MQYSKTEDNKLKVTNSYYYRDGSTYSQDNIYDRQFIENQVISITAQRDEMIAIKEKELAEVNALIEKCNELNILIETIVETHVEAIVETPLVTHE